MFFIVPTLEINFSNVLAVFSNMSVIYVVQVSVVRSTESAVFLYAQLDISLFHHRHFSLVYPPLPNIQA